MIRHKILPSSRKIQAVSRECDFFKLLTHSARIHLLRPTGGAVANDLHMERRNRYAVIAAFDSILIA